MIAFHISKRRPGKGPWITHVVIDIQHQFSNHAGYPPIDGWIVPRVAIKTHNLDIPLDIA